jgi:peptide-methionine (R)-S-oxide reductase
MTARTWLPLTFALTVASPCLGCRSDRTVSAPGASATSKATPAQPTTSKSEETTMNATPNEGPAITKDEIEANKKKLNAKQYAVTQKNGTEPPFANEYWDNHAPGIYVDVVSGEPLFSSNEKFESGTGWPSFFAPLEKKNVVSIEDDTHGMVRTERTRTSGTSSTTGRRRRGCATASTARRSGSSRRSG